MPVKSARSSLFAREEARGRESDRRRDGAALSAPTPSGYLEGLQVLAALLASSRTIAGLQYSAIASAPHGDGGSIAPRSRLAGVVRFRLSELAFQFTGARGCVASSCLGADLMSLRARFADADALAARGEGGKTRRRRRRLPSARGGGGSPCALPARSSL